MKTSESSLRAERERIVREHMESENRHDFDATLASFDHPRYELIATGRTFRCRMTAFFIFEETRLVCERVYFDSESIRRQLTSPSAPDSPSR